MSYLVKHLINGDYVETTVKANIYNPALGKVVGQVTMGDISTVNMAIHSAKEALKSWQTMSPLKRSRIFFKYKELLEQHKEELAKLITQEHGKVISDALGEVQRGIEVVEFACGAPHLLKGEFSEQVATGVDSYSIRQAVGVCVGITPFNFPTMVPLWMIPMALICGNTFILKPSEKDPSSSNLLAELLYKAGLPKGVLQVVHGDKTVVDALITHSDVAAISFVGSTPIARYIYETGTRHKKRVQALGGAKNHCVVMPDADMDNTVANLIGAAYGSAGERCMAISVAVVVGDDTANEFIKKMSAAINKITIGNGVDSGVELGPVISQVHKDKIVSYINLGVEQKATLVKDGRHVTVAGHQNGFFVGPTLFDHVTPEMTIYKEEIFGPVLAVVRVGSQKEAIALINKCPFANGTAIFTRDGAAARQFASEIQVGMVGINVPIPVPMAFYAFAGWKDSKFGSDGIYGVEGIHFYTALKTVTVRWSQTELTKANLFIMPTLE